MDFNTIAPSMTNLNEVIPSVQYVYHINQYSQLGIITIMLMTYLTAIIIHELAHFYTLRRHVSTANIHYSHYKGKMPYIRTGTDLDYEELQPKDLQLIYGAGVIAGAVWIFFVAATVYAFSALIFIPYIMSCAKDIKLWKEASK